MTGGVLWNAPDQWDPAVQMAEGVLPPWEQLVTFGSLFRKTQVSPAPFVFPPAPGSPRSPFKLACMSQPHM